MDRFSSALDNFSDSIEEKLKSANKIAEVMNEQMLSTLKELSETLKQQAENDTATRAEEYKKSSGALEGLIKTMTQTMTDAQKNSENARKEHQQEWENEREQQRAASEQFLSTLSGLSQTLQSLAGKIKTQQEKSLGNFETHMDGLISSMKEFSDKQQSLLDTIARSNSAQILSAVSQFKEIIDRHNETIQKTFNQIRQLLADSKTFLQDVKNAGTSLKQAAEPVRQSSLQLSNHLDKTTRAAEKFRNEITTQMNALGSVNLTTRKNIAELTDKLGTFVKNFNGIAGDLERSTNVIKNSLENYNYRMSEGLRDALNKFDENMNASVGNLEGIMEDLTEILSSIRGRKDER